MVAIILPMVAVPGLAAMCTKVFRRNWRLRSHAAAVVVLAMIAIMTGCGGSSSFSASPGGTGGGSGGGGGSTPPATTVQAVTVTTTSLAAGATSSAMVTLSAAAPTGGASVSLTSSNATAANVPASVMVAAGQTTGAFMVTAGSVSVDTSVSISAAYNNTVAGMTVSVKAAPPAPGTPIAVSISPASGSVVAQASLQFTATVTGTSNTAVNWTASGGTITNGGLFTAPNVSVAGTVTVTATSQADTTKTKSAQVTVTPIPPPPPTPVSVSVSPTSATVAALATQQFTATVTGGSNPAVSWTASAGSINAAGLFTAPSVSATTTVTVTATSQADPTKSKAAQVTVTAAPPPPPGPVASWKAYQYKDTDGIYHQAIAISNSKGAYPVIGYSYSDAGCTDLGDKFNDFWQPLGNGIWWFTHRPDLIYVKWVWYNNPTEHVILQQTPCIDYSAAPKYN